MIKTRKLYLNIGNTTLTAGYFSGDKFIVLKSLPSTKSSIAKLSFRGVDFMLLVIASVVPELTVLVKRKFKGRVLEIKNSNVPIINLYRDKNAVGVDRLLAALGAFRKYKKASIVVDFGTATTINVVLKKGEYKGGVIAPGVSMFSSYLFEKTSKLPELAVKTVRKAVGRSTKECIASGVFFGNIEMITGLIRRVKKESGISFCIATGGAGALFSKYIKEIDSYDPYLVFKGMRETNKSSNA